MKTKSGETKSAAEPAHGELRGANQGSLPILKLSIKRFNSSTSIRLWCWKIVLRFALLAGYPVILVGACRTGKTLLLTKLTPGNVVDHSVDARKGGGQLSLNESKVPRGIYSIDECQLIEPMSLKALTQKMAERQRAFCLSAQRYSAVRDAVDAYRSNEKARRIVLVVVGGQQNPITILKELPQ